MPSPRVNSFTQYLHDFDTLSLFSDEAIANRYLEIEVALASAQAKLGIIPESSAQAIRDGKKALALNYERLANSTRQNGFPIIEIVAQLRQAVGSKAAAHVHYGSTTQDIMDTAMALQLREVASTALNLLDTVMRQLAKLAVEHKRAIVTGRTHLQPAQTISLGLRFSNWLGPLARHRQRLSELWPETFVLQFGGATGTGAVCGAKTPALAETLSEALGLEFPQTPWHTQRDRFSNLANWIQGVTQSLAKIAKDVLLLTQSEIAELKEKAQGGGSSAMPHKQNAIVSEGILARAHSVSAHAHAIASAPSPELERGTCNVQIEQLHFPSLCSLAIAALRDTQSLLESLQVIDSRIRQNIESSYGTLASEALGLELSRHIEPGQARKLIREACIKAMQERIHVVDALRQVTDLELPWESLRETEKQTGCSDVFIDQTLATCEAALAISIPHT